MKRKPAELGEVDCEVCKLRVKKRSPSQRLCETCSIRRDRDRKAAWQRAHYQPGSRNPKNIDRARMRAAAAAAFPPQGKISWRPSEIGIDMAWMHRISLPFSYALSKNAVWSMAKGGGHVYMRKRASQAREAVRAALAEAIRQSGRKPVEAKVYIDLFVQKPDHKGDAINVIDSVCDGVKDALGIDDRWFSIRGLDWEIVKHNPRIFVGVGQAATEHHRVCSICGRILPVADFGVRKAGCTRECLGCRRLTGNGKKL